MSVQVGKMACLHAGDSSPKRCYGSDRLRPTLSPQGVKPQPVRLKTKCTQEQTGGCKAAPARSSSCPSSHGCQLRPTAQMRGRGEGRREELLTMACRNTKTNWERKDTCTHTDCTRTGMR